MPVWTWNLVHNGPRDLGPSQGKSGDRPLVHAPQSPRSALPPPPRLSDGAHPASLGCPELTGQRAVGGSSCRLVLPSAAPGSLCSEAQRF